MNQKTIQASSFWHICLIFFIPLIFLTSCTVQEPISIARKKGNITGRVLPLAISATVSATQGVKMVATTTSDSAGFYYLANLTHGVYTLLFSADGFGSHFENEIIVYEGGTTAVKDVYLEPFPEQISGSEPRNSQVEYTLNAPIIIYFNQPMDENSVENAFHISPLLTGNFYWNASSTTITFQPEPQLMASENYQVILASTARTRSGVSLSFPFALSFSTAAVQVAQTFPLNGTIGVSTGTSLLISFNSAMNKTQLPHSFSILPEILGEFKWVDSESFLFVPGTLLEPDTDYQITLDSLLSDVYGKTTGEPFILYFGTEPTRILHTTPQNGAEYIARGTQILIAFNANMNQNSVQSALQISPNVSGQMRWDDHSTLRFVPNTLLTASTTYTLRIGTTAKTLAEHTLSESFALEFTTAP